MSNGISHQYLHFFWHSRKLTLRNSNLLPKPSYNKKFFFFFGRYLRFVSIVKEMVFFITIYKILMDITDDDIVSALKDIMIMHKYLCFIDLSQNMLQINSLVYY